MPIDKSVELLHHVVATPLAPAFMSTGLISVLVIGSIFGKDWDRLVVLLAGGTKKRQDADIAAAKEHWRDYKRRKRQEVT